jgi:serine/threonine-protein kinase
VATALPIRAAVHVLAPGTLLAGRFAIKEVTHRSGMSTVYMARENGGVRVAVKHVSAAGLSAEEKAETVHWLAREAGLLSSLHNPHLPELIAAFSEGDDHYVVMPYLEGKTVKELVARDEPLPEAHALHWAESLAEVLA